MKWYERLAKWLKKNGHHRSIYRPNLQTGLDEQYLERYYILSTKWIGIYLHNFWSSDDDGLHTHPWHSVSVLLKEGYYEEEPIDKNNPHGSTKIHYRCPLHPFFKIRTKKSAHRITIPDGGAGKCWSLFIRFGIKRQIWGFYRDNKFEPAYVQSRKDMLQM